MSERAPDSIEPYVGFKYLKAMGGSGGYKLYSHNGSTSWPHGKALEAQCLKDWGYQWEVSDRAEARQPYKNGKRQESRFNQSPIQKNQWWIGEIPLSYKPPKRPIVELPDRLAWSYNKMVCPHDPVDEECACGIYVVDNADDAVFNYTHYGRLLVKVALWGKVIVAEKGARGQYAYPLEICGSSQTNDEKLMEGVGIAYGVPFPGYTPPAPEPELHIVPDNQSLVCVGDAQSPVDGLVKSRGIRAFFNL